MPRKAALFVYGLYPLVSGSSLEIEARPNIIALGSSNVRWRPWVDSL